MEQVSFSCDAFAVHTCEPRQRKRKCKKGISKKKTGSIASMPPRRREVQERTSGAWVIKTRQEI